MKTCRFFCKEFEFFFLIGEFELLLSVFNLSLLKGNNNIFDYIFYEFFSSTKNLALFFNVLIFIL